MDNTAPTSVTAPFIWVLTPKRPTNGISFTFSTKLCWSRTYRQFVKEVAGTIRVFGKTADEARSNYERFVADNWQNGPEPEPAPIISHRNIATNQYDVKTVEDIANAYVAWCYDNWSDKHGKDAKSVRSQQRRGQPVISVNTKKKELVGNFKNKGQEWHPQGNPEKVRVHDFIDKELGKVAPYGVYDLTKTTAGSVWALIATPS